MICPKKKKCSHCSSTATRSHSRIDTTNYLPNFKRFHFFNRIFRHWFKRGVYSTEYLCEAHYFENMHGLVTFKCGCGKSFLIDFDELEEYFFGDGKQIFCPFCKKKATSHYEQMEKEYKVSKHGIAVIFKDGKKDES